MKNTTLLIIAILVAVAATALVAASPDSTSSEVDSRTDEGTIYIPEGLHLESWSVGVGRGDLVHVERFDGLAVDTSTGEQYILHLTSLNDDEERPRWVYRVQGVPMEELTQ